MQAVIAIPDLETLKQYGGAKQALMCEVCGVPLLVRTIKAGIRAGVKSIVVIWPSRVPEAIWLCCQAALASECVDGITLVQAESFRPRQTSAWTAIAPLLAECFLWLPWNFVTHKRALLDLGATPVPPISWSQPVILEKVAVLFARRIRSTPKQWVEGILVTSQQTAR